MFSIVALSAIWTSSLLNVNERRMGDYDAVLKWPFNYKDTLYLYDQSGQNQNVIDYFRSDAKSYMSIIQQDGNHYVRDDTMFIKIIVDLAKLPKIILPYALSLSSSLPYHDQQDQINREIKRDENADIVNAASLLDLA
ncbi:unnamed protein product [Didymodactylos carnosus]|uniref:TRAF1-6 MATH domain-containing protein n=1 Tax=Didymodactylos carnosus TaxID=1234261 RepID=A0A815GRB8_9BILA|nr:unnamed protein product [Didymodactylos carnosus]CAF4207284.1 unnamed protein product [Didymodactylos carnosus]